MCVWKIIISVVLTEQFVPTTEKTTLVEATISIQFHEEDVETDGRLKHIDNWSAQMYIKCKRQLKMDRLHFRIEGVSGEGG